MKLTHRFGSTVSVTFLAAVIIFSLGLTWMVVQAQKISNKWQDINEQSIIAAGAQ